MKQLIIKWTFRLSMTGLFIAILLLVIILNPVLTYSNKTNHYDFTIFHNKAIDESFILRLDDASALLKSSELYRPGIQLDICLNDGSVYSPLMEKIRGQAFAWGFYDKVVLQGKTNAEENYTELNGYKWNLKQLLAHEMIHCLQFDKLGLLKSNPVGRIPAWKWEGYAEYIARQGNNEKNLSDNIIRLLETDKRDAQSWGIELSDHTIAPREYYYYWIQMQYCMDVRQMTYMQVLADTVKEESVRNEMMKWYSMQRN